MNDRRPPIVAPFRGLRFNPTKIKDLAAVTAPPYDVISPEGQKALYERHPNNVVRLILGYQNPNDTEADNRYTRAAKDFRAWSDSGILLRDREPCLYLYQQDFEMKGRGRFSRRGFLALRRVEEFGRGESGQGRISPHERTLAGPKADRLLLLKACRANFSPIFALYSDPEGAMKALLDRHFASSDPGSPGPASDFTDDEGVRHRLWRVSDRELFLKADTLVGAKNLFIADGHHRYETAIAFRDWMMGLHPQSPPDASFHYVMMFFSEMSDPGLVILPTHRVLQNWQNWPGFDRGSFETRLKEWFEVRPFSREALEKEGREGRQAFGLIFGGGEARLLVLRSGATDRIESLQSIAPAARRVDTLILHRAVFQEILGMKEDDDKDPRFLRFVKEDSEAIAAAREPGVHAVFLLNASPMPVLRDVVEAGMILPPKTTYFYPKLLTGLVMNPIDPSERVSIGS